MEQEQKKKMLSLGMKIREQALKAVQVPNSGHIGGSFSEADILAVLYFDKMNIDPENPRMQDRDRFVLSKGHASPALYATLALRGFFPVEELKTFRNADSDLSGHVEMTKVRGVDMSAGSLGQGLSAAVGMAVSGQIYQKDYRVYAMVGDGEIQEGQIWEAVMAAGNYKLDNLMLFVDNNNLQIDGTVEEVMSPYPIDDKFKAFNWNVICIDGHDPEAIAAAVEQAGACKGKPTVAIAKTVKGKGVSFMENNVNWHGKTPTPEQYEQAFKEIREQIEELEV
ncbi:transketolase [Kineothrix alysoides]|uniref:Transketolase n=1 Tax=Kineothrix alysoides TaxID=1469948 RepID=A0A4R1R0U2_9FIRM|nr:transketolase [Kineothrix alysoides]TCL58933.1 transketolase [Kineothrix alysoides]